MVKPKIITGKEIRNKAWLTIYEEQDEYVYAAEYDALLADVRVLVEAAKETIGYMDITFCYKNDWTPLMTSKFVVLRKALAAVEARIG